MSIKLTSEDLRKLEKKVDREQRKANGTLKQTGFGAHGTFKKNKADRKKRRQECEDYRKGGDE